MSVTADLMDVMALGTVHDYGDQALLLEFESTAEVLAWADALHEAVWELPERERAARWGRPGLA